MSELKSCVKDEVAVLGSTFLISPQISLELTHTPRALRSCVKGEVAVLGSTFLTVIVRTVSVDVGQH